MFSKRHYEAIALAMQDAKPLPNWDANKHTQWDVCVSRLADAFGRDNGLFKRERFLAACQPGANVRARTTAKAAGVSALSAAESGDFAARLPGRPADGNDCRWRP